MIHPHKRSLTCSELLLRSSMQLIIKTEEDPKTKPWTFLQGETEVQSAVHSSPPTSQSLLILFLNFLLHNRAAEAEGGTNPPSSR